MRAAYRLARGAPGVVVAKVVHSRGLAAKTTGLLALGRALTLGAEARRANVDLAPKRAKARDGVVLARGAQVGQRIAVLLALLLLLLALSSAG